MQFKWKCSFIRIVKIFLYIILRQNNNKRDQRVYKKRIIRNIEGLLKSIQHRGNNQVYIFVMF